MRDLGNAPESDLKILSALVGAPLVPPAGVPVAGTDGYHVSAKSAQPGAVVEHVFYDHQYTNPYNTNRRYVARIHIRLTGAEACIGLDEITAVLGGNYERLRRAPRIKPPALPHETDIWSLGHKLSPGARVIFSFGYRKCAWSLTVWIP